MLKLLPPLLFLTLLCTCGPAPEKSSPGSDEASQPPKEDWEPMFNGKDFSGWDIKFAGRELNDNYLNTFAWEDGMLRIKYDAYESFDEDYAHMYYKQPYSHYKLRFDYRFTGEQTPGGIYWNERNSGIMLHSQSAESNELKQGFPISVELQLLGGLSDGETRPTANVCTPGTTVVMGDTLNNKHCISSSSKTYDGDQWIHVEAVVLGDEAMYFMVEGDTVLTFTEPQIGGWKKDGKQFDDFGFERDKELWMKQNGRKLKGGYIALQAESHPIDFKNLEILALEGNTSDF
jgi:hypothetical protein